ARRLRLVRSAGRTERVRATCLMPRPRCSQSPRRSSAHFSREVMDHSLESFSLKEHPMPRYLCIAAAALAMGIFALAGCKKNESAQNTSTTDNRTAGEKTRDAIANSGEAAGNAAGKAVDKTAEGARTAGE